MHATNDTFADHSAELTAAVDRLLALQLSLTCCEEVVSNYRDLYEDAKRAADAKRVLVERARKEVQILTAENLAMRVELEKGVVACQ